MGLKFDLEDVAGGALQEKVHEAIEEVIQNMKDPNTPWKNTRSVKIELQFMQNEERDDCTCHISVTKKLAGDKPIQTRFAIGKDLSTGKVYAHEYGNQIKGQMNINEFLDENVDKETGEIMEAKSNVVDFRKKA